MLTTGASTQEFTIRRNAWSESEESVVPCPKLVKDYHHNMRGVDVHEQLQLQRYSVQMASTFKKYYKTLFLGLLDLALVNEYVVHRAYYAGVGKRGLSHSEFLTSLQTQLLSVRPQHMTDSESISTVHSSSPTSVLESRPQRANIPAEHVPVETEDFDKEVGHPDRKRMARACKVCSILAEEGKRGKNTKWLCEACSAKHPGEYVLAFSKWSLMSMLICDKFSCSVYLCQLVRHNSFGTMKSCFAIYHDDWECGMRIPMISDKRIQYRQPNGKRKRLTAQ
ncbi:Hypothetical protein PHPALM_36394 [Phytophthora palmivora]|uniref:PiggyBac transposable element-derived protein domain-containing protein n=1 Tax=Phytophthora palmivora TaxID=4796 RepID=A0A2P4X026_9STRA|nr:Hypothetical protein PHPALM_36394 [Phytophthora palmivora]